MYRTAALILQLLCLLNSYAQLPAVEYKTAHYGKITCTDVSADDRYLATGAADGRAIIRDIQSGSLLQAIAAHSDALTAVLFIQRDSCLLTSSFDGTLKLWNIRDASLIWETAAFTGVIADAAGGRTPMARPVAHDLQQNRILFYRRENTPDEPVYYLICKELSSGKEIKLGPVWCESWENFRIPLEHDISEDGKWAMWTSGSGDPDLAPSVRLMNIEDTSIQYRWWASEGRFDGNEAILSNEYALWRFDPNFERESGIMVNGGYGYHKHFSGNNHLLMECLQQEQGIRYKMPTHEAGKPPGSIPDSMSFYLLGRKELHLPAWRLFDIRDGSYRSIAPEGDSSHHWVPEARWNQQLTEKGLLVFSCQGDPESLVFYHGPSSGSIRVNLKGSFGISTLSAVRLPRDIEIFKDNVALLISFNMPEGHYLGYPMYLLSLDFDKGRYSLTKWTENDVLNTTAMSEDFYLPALPLVLLPQGKGVISGNAAGGVTIADFEHGRIEYQLIDNKLKGADTLWVPASCSENGRFYVGVNSKVIMHLATGKPVPPKMYKLTGKWIYHNRPELFPDTIARHFLYGRWEWMLTGDNVYISDTKSGNSYSLVTDGSKVADMAMADDRWLVVLGYDGGLRHYSLADGRLVCTRFMYKNGNWILFTPEGQYDFYTFSGTEILSPLGAWGQMPAGLKWEKGLNTRLFK